MLTALRAATRTPRLPLRQLSTMTHTGPAGDITRITVFGAGLMGAGIAQVAAQAGLHVTLADVTEGALANGLGIIGASVPRVAKRLAPGDEEAFAAAVLGRIRTTTDAAAAVRGAQVVLEAIVEKLPAKQALFAELDALADPAAVFASNTSGLLISEIAAKVSPDRKTRFGGLHFFNPVPVMKLVEVPRTEEISDEAFELLYDLAVRLGKTPVRCKDTPGFIMNRLNVPYKLEVVRMLERGDATAEDIDTAMKLGAGYPMGPLELFDLTGIDTTHYLTLGWQEYAKRGLMPEELVRPTKMMADMVEKGEIGRKSGKGFYDYSSGKKESRGAKL